MSIEQLTVSDILLSLIRDGGAGLRSLRESSNTLPTTLLLLVVDIALSVVYGISMGFPASFRQSVSSAAKLPLLFLGPLAVCFPAIVMTSLMTGESVVVTPLLNLLLATIARALLAMTALAPIAIFFGFGSSYDFMKLLHVGVISISSLVALHALHSSLAGEGGLIRFLVWTALYGFVAAQLAWKLRPFLGEPGHPFEWIRRGSSDMDFYSAVLDSLRPKRGAGTAHASEATAPAASALD